MKKKYVDIVKEFEKGLTADQKKKFYELELLHERELYSEEDQEGKLLEEINKHKSSRAFEFYKGFQEKYKNRDRLELALYIYEKAYEDGKEYGKYIEKKYNE